MRSQFFAMSLPDWAMDATKSAGVWGEFKAGYFAPQHRAGQTLR
jgi:hypothetical protein